MKKISLKEVKNSLKRDEMRAIIGGSGRKCGNCTSAYDCASTCNSCFRGTCEPY